MRQRVTFGFKDKRRDQRRPVSIEGSIGGARVDLVDLSFTGIGGGAMELHNAANDLRIEEGEQTRLEITGAGGQKVSLQVTIQRIDRETGMFGATFRALSSAQFDAIEKLMFPRRRAV